METQKRPAPAHFTREHQQMARRRISSEACARNGRLGAQATIAKYGFAAYFENWRRWKLEHPSGPEIVITGILHRLGAQFEREWRLEPSFLTLDFYLPGSRRGIEFHGRIHGTLRQQQREANDIKKRASLEEAGIECLWLNASDLDDVATLIGKIQSFITTKGGRDQ